MIVQPKVRGFICATAHPIGCSANVQQQIDYVKAQGSFEGPKKVLVLGASTGFGLASRIAAAFGSGAGTIGVSYEKLPTDKKTATAGYYNTVAFDKKAQAEGLVAVSLNGDAFSDEIKEQTIAAIKENLGKVDMVIYSLASPRRTDPETGESYSSVLKPTKATFTNKTIDITTGQLSDVVIEPASEEEIRGTMKVMGGEDWMRWIQFLSDADVLEEGAMALAYSYIGPQLTFPIYRDGSIGRAKEHLEATAQAIAEKFADKKIQAYVSVNKALVTQASSAIPVVPLYISILFKLMKEKGIHEGCIEQMYRMFSEKITPAGVIVDEDNRIRLDDWEMRYDIQEAVQDIWENLTQEKINAEADLTGYQDAFYNLFGFGFEGVDYDADVDIM